MSLLSDVIEFRREMSEGLMDAVESRVDPADVGGINAWRLRLGCSWATLSVSTFALTNRGH